VLGEQVLELPVQDTAMLVGAGCAILAVVLYVRFIRFEEQALEQTFGDDYRAYKARVRRWL